jgi:hypothetical protein
LKGEATLLNKRFKGKPLGLPLLLKAGIVKLIFMVYNGLWQPYSRTKISRHGKPEASGV